MSETKKQQQKELFEKLEELCKAKNDPELDKTVEALKATFAPAGDEGGGNNPSVPDIP